MQDMLKQVFAHPLPSAAVLCAVGAATGYLGLVVPTTVLFLLAGLVLMIASGRGRAAPDSEADSALAD